MKVYVVCQQNKFAETEIVGVYSSLKKAEALGLPDVEECDLDSEPRSSDDLAKRLKERLRKSDT
jgi:hypothetical protein